MTSSGEKRERSDYDLIKSLKHIPPVRFISSREYHSLVNPLNVQYLSQYLLQFLLITEELRSYVIGNIARTCAIFGISEIVLFNDFDSLNDNELKKYKDKPHLQPDAIMNYFTLILEYLETPQYLRRSIFDYERDLKYAGLLNPLDSPHHMRANEWLPFRQGILEAGYTAEGGFVECGLPSKVRVDNVREFFKVKLPRKERKNQVAIEASKSNRVTVQLDIKSLTLCYKLKYEDLKDKNIEFSGKIVPDTLPRTLMGIYWGYNVRQCQSFDEIFKNDNYEYDMTIGTSEHGQIINNEFKIPKYEHMLIVFGGLRGLEAIVDNPKKKFNYYINICENQKSRTIRTEEAIMICLSKLYPFNL